MTPHMDLEATSLVIRLIAAWVGAGELACFSEVSAIMGEECTEGDESFLTTCRKNNGRLKMLFVPGIYQ